MTESQPGWWKPTVVGADNLPTTGSVLAVNRVSGFDHLLVGQALSRRLTTVCSHEDGLWRLPGAPTTSFFDTTEHGPVEILAAGGTVLVFPERRCGNDGAVHRGAPDVAALALLAEVPIVPGALVPRTHDSQGSWSAAPGRWALGELRYSLVIGEPIDVTHYLGLDQPGEVSDGLMLRGLTDTVMAAIAALAGREYVDSCTFGSHHRGAATRLPTDLPGLRDWVLTQRDAHRQRRALQRQRMAAEAELARFLDEQEAAELAEAEAAARHYAEQMRTRGAPDAHDL